MTWSHDTDSIKEYAFIAAGVWLIGAGMNVGAAFRPRARKLSEFGKLAAYLGKITRSEGFAAVYEPCGDELRVSLDRGSAEI